MKLRPAAEDDVAEMIEAMFAEPSVEQLAFIPTVAGARRFTRALWLIAGLDEFVVAEEDGEVVGFAWCSACTNVMASKSCPKGTTGSTSGGPAHPAES